MLKQSRSLRKINLQNLLNFSLKMVVVISWLTTFYIFFYVNPDKLLPYFYSPFWLAIFVSLMSTIYLFVKRIIYAVLPSLAIVTILILRSWAYTQWYYPVLILGLTIALIYFFTSDQENDTLGDDSLIN